MRSSGYSLVFRVERIGQKLRNLRAELVPPLLTLAEGEVIEGISCFMVEQYLSSFIDSEIADFQSLKLVRKHLDRCRLCNERLHTYRSLQSQILASRLVFTKVEESEWQGRKNFDAHRRRISLFKALFTFLLLLAFAGFIAWVFWSKPEKMPNVYEIP